MNKLALQERFNDYLRSTESWWTSERVNYLVDSHFGSLPLKNRSVIEIGAGSGIFSAACAARGASRVVSLEPEVAGSSQGVYEDYCEMEKAVDFGGIIDYRRTTLDEFAEGYQSPGFDYIVLKAVINHLNERAVERLHLKEAETERETYVGICRHIGKLLAPHGAMIMSDVARLNFWNCIGIKNPFASSIEWHKHQQPKVWEKILRKSGFRQIETKWPTPFRLRRMRLLLDGLVPSFFLQSAFVITAWGLDENHT